MLNLRQQLSMFVPVQAAIDVERVRRVVDPVQSSLIPAHITLCREDELWDLPAIRSRLQNLRQPAISLSFAAAEIFYEHGLIMHCVAGADAFLHLREFVLDSKDIRAQHPHMTLAHPRNPKAPGNSLDVAANLPTPLQLVFPSICLIEQSGNDPWRVLETYEFSVGA
ncbi:2'-5' RNA ligase family protein [Undibacterium sp. TC4M20W]|uniref:2'-5' RNA ligase family protein n=1 Tax=Undibacterium sp. TC4M20W TaxID=3413052 RepID=UPI003BF385E5